MSDVFRKFEHEGWQNAAGKYDAAWSELMRPFAAHLVDAISVGPGSRLLDVACGPGYVAEAAHALGTTATGLDFSAEMIDVASRRNPGIEFREGDALAVPFPDASFDAVAMNFGLLHLSDPGLAFRESRRVLRPGGWYGFTVWAPPEISPGAAVIHEAIKAHAVPNTSIPKGPDYFAFGTPDDCREGLGKAGFEPDTLVFRTLKVDWTVPTATFLYDSELKAGVRTGALLNAQSTDVLEAIRQDVAQATEAFATEAGYTLPFAAHIVAVRKPRQGGG